MAKQMYGAHSDDERDEIVSKSGNGNSNKKVIIAIIATALVFILAFVFVYFKFLKQSVTSQGQLMVDTKASANDNSNPLSGRSVSFVGINDATIAVGDTIELENVPENEDFLLKFQIVDTDSGQEVYSTDLIPSGQSVIWTPSENLDKGVHHLAFMQTPFWMRPDGEYMPLTAGNNKVELTIE